MSKDPQERCGTCNGIKFIEGSCATDVRPCPDCSAPTGTEEETRRRALEAALAHDTELFDAAGERIEDFDFIAQVVLSALFPAPTEGEEPTRSTSCGTEHHAHCEAGRCSCPCHLAEGEEPDQTSAREIHEDGEGVSPDDPSDGDANSREASREQSAPAPADRRATASTPPDAEVQEGAKARGQAGPPLSPATPEPEGDDWPEEVTLVIDVCNPPSVPPRILAADELDHVNEFAHEFKLRRYIPAAPSIPVEDRNDCHDFVDISNGTTLDVSKFRRCGTISPYAKGRTTRADFKAAREAVLPSIPIEQGSGEAADEVAARQVVISYGGGPLDGRSGFAPDLRPLQLDTGTYRWVVAHPEGDVEFVWGPTHFPGDAPSPPIEQGEDGA